MVQFKGTVNGSLGSKVNFYLDASFQERTADQIARNVSNVTLHAWAQATSTDVGVYNLTNNPTSKISYTKNSTETIVVNRNQTMDFRNKAIVELGTWTGEISHNPDGSLTLELSAEFNTKVSQWVTTGSLSGSWTLTTIPRTSSFSATNTDIESTCKITISRASTAFTHTLTYSFGSLSGTIASGVSDSYNWTIPSSFYAQIPNSKTGACTIKCVTYSGSTKVGETSTAITITASESKCKPTVGGSVVDTNSTTIALTGSSSKLIKYRSTAKVTGTATAKNSASISSIKIDGSANPLTIQNVSKNSFTIVATDSRGYTNSVTISATMIDYVPLTCKAEFKRKIQTGSEVLLNYSGNYFNDSFGSVSNSLTMSWAYKEKSESTYTSGGTLSPTKDGNSYSGSISCGSIFDYQTDYEFIIYYADKLDTNLNTGTILVSKGVGALEIYNNAVLFFGEIIFVKNSNNYEVVFPENTIIKIGSKEIVTTDDVGIES